MEDSSEYRLIAIRATELGSIEWTAGLALQNAL